jgi:hypothetical protein
MLNPPENENALIGQALEAAADQASLALLL